LKVTKPRDTKLLEISATHPDARTAQAVAQYIAEQTVEMSRAEDFAGDNVMLTVAQHQVEIARTRLSDLQKAAAELASREPVVGLQSDIDADIELLAGLRQRLVDAQASAAENRTQLAGNEEFTREQYEAATARAALLGQRVDELRREIDNKSAVLAARSARKDALAEDLKVAQAGYETASNALRTLEVGAGTHGEVLRIVDPGVIPGVPGSPNVFLNFIVALLIAAVGSFAFISISFAYSRRLLDAAAGEIPAPISRSMRA
jgi:capsule polysaccharide export protein KpsE/RkpR